MDTKQLHVDNVVIVIVAVVVAIVIINEDFFLGTIAFFGVILFFVKITYKTLWFY